MNNDVVKNNIKSLIAVDVLLFVMYGAMLFITYKRDIESADLYVSLYKSAENQENTLSLERTIKNTEVERSLIDSYFVPEAEISSFIERVESLGKAADVSLKMNSVQKTTNKKFELSFVAGGTFANVYRTLLLVEAMPFSVKIKNLQMSKNTELSTPDTEKERWFGSFVISLESFIAQ
jgi:hypothetical protein